MDTSHNLETTYIGTRWSIEAYLDPKVKHKVAVAVTGQSAHTVWVWTSDHNRTAQTVSNLALWSRLPKTVKQAAWRKLSKWERRIARQETSKE